MHGFPAKAADHVLQASTTAGDCWHQLFSFSINLPAGLVATAQTRFNGALMELFIQRCFDGMFTGAIYASLALAIVMIYRSTGLLNFAQGEMGLMGGYVALTLLSPAGSTGIGIPIAGTAFLSRWLPLHPWPTWAAILGAVAFGALLGAVIERFIMRPLADRSSLSQVNVTIGLLILINGIVFQIWGSFSRRVKSPFPTGKDDYFGIFGARLRYTTVGVWATLLVVIVLLSLLIQKTKTGLAFRAITSNREGAALVGVPVSRTLTIGWAIASAIGALAAALVGGAITLNPLTMLNLLIYALAAATIGGLDSPRGAIAGGLIIGLTQSLAPPYLGIPTELTLLPPLAAMVLALTVRPHGLFGTVPVNRV
ncbi:MAG TPA: branched-chain amino acid ABC transporter permease [Acidimicrobiaceae bacterium]|nr:branched-chain amino acid ABC transporter permease [bacterium]HAY67151.1 branched-chain amino acid ABC transporter permease [Acidimicrobiaceae bacterium]